MAASQKKAPAKSRTPRKKSPVSKAVNKEVKEPKTAEPEAEEVLVRPLDPRAFQFVMQIIDQANIKGSDASNIVNLRMELARVANAKPAPRQ